MKIQSQNLERTILTGLLLTSLVLVGGCNQPSGGGATYGGSSGNQSSTSSSESKSVSSDTKEKDPVFGKAAEQ